MELKLRSGTPVDGEVCGRICYNAFKQRRVQRTRRSVPSIYLVLAAFLGATNRYDAVLENVTNLFEQILATHGYRFAGGRRYRN